MKSQNVPILRAGLKSLWEACVDVVFPQNCLLCRCHAPSADKTKLLCPACLHGIAFNQPPFCARCSRHLPAPVTHDLCANCRRQPVFFDRAWGATRYIAEMPRLLHLFKYGQKTGLRFTFAALITSFLKEYHLCLKNYDALICIPLHPVRLRERTFNQTSLIAAELQKIWKLPLWPDALSRHRSTGFQARLRSKERWTNVERAFRIKTPFAIKGKNILLLDDLLTTGATASQAAQILKNSGAERVDVLTLAIAE